MDHPDNLSQDDIIKVLEDDINGEMYHTNKVTVFIHKSHKPKGYVSIDNNEQNPQYLKSKKLFWKGLIVLFRDLFR